LLTIRQQVREMIVRLGAVPFLIEDDATTDDNILQRSYNIIQEADVFVGIYASDYGEIPGSEVVYQRTDQTIAHGDGQTSLLHWEYLWAMERRLPILVFVMSETDDSPYKSDNSRLPEFKRLIASTHPAGLFSSPNQLAQQVEKNLAVLLKLPAAPVQRFKGYELREVIGAGTFGMVYRAHQTAVDREVAIKLLLPEYTHQPDFIRSFETEAQLIARLEHPHIVPLFDYWRDADSTCLVMRFMRGGSVSDRIKGQPLPLEDVLRWVEQIGAALAFAHRHGVIHRDLKPDNLLLDDEGNAYLSDFGIARMTGWAAGNNTVSGTLAYMSPEQLKGEAPRPQADLYSFGIIIYELLTGQHPFAGQTPDELVASHLDVPLPDVTLVCPELSPMVQIVIERATDKIADQRYADARAMTAAFRRAVSMVLTPHAPVVLDEPSPITNPYKGLRAFQEYDAGDFFGREGFVGGLIERMRQMPVGRLLAVVGPSGSGKSSVVKAGLLPALRQGALPGSQHWFITDMVPSSHPFEHLKEALLRVAIHPPLHLLEALQEDDRGLLGMMSRILPADDDTELLLVIDQFEELFTLTTDEAERMHFLNSLLTVLEDTRTRLRVVLTLRADFYDKPLRYLEFGTWLRKSLETVLPLSSVELEQSIVRPAEQVGALLEKGLVSAILQEVTDQPGILPLLQYAMTELFEQRKGLTLTFEAYKSMGGVTGALGQRAESLYASLNLTEKEAVRQVFLRLITLGEGTEDTRRRVRQSEFDASVLPVIHLFGVARLLTFDRDSQTREPTVEVAHEALLRTWSRLKDWIVSAREDVSIHRRLSQATHEWFSADQDSGFLAREAPLDQFEGWASMTSLSLNAMERAFLDASLAERERRHAFDIARKAHEAKTARRAQNLGRAAAAFAFTGILAIALTAFAFIHTTQLEQKSATVRTEMANVNTTATNAAGTASAANATATNAAGMASAANATATNAAGTASAANMTSTVVAFESQTLSLLNAAQSLQKTDRGLAIHLALLAADRPGASEHPSALAESVLNSIVYTRGPALPPFMVQGDPNPVNSVAFSPDGKTVVSGAYGLRLWDAATGKTLVVFKFLMAGQAVYVRSVAFSPDGKTVSSGSDDNTVRLWDVATGQQIGEPLTGHKGPVNSVAFSPDGQTIISGSDDGTLILWDAATGQALGDPFVGHSDVVTSVAFGSDGQTIVSGSNDDTIRLWNRSTGESRVVIRDDVSSLALSPDSAKLVYASSSGTLQSGMVKLWDIATEQVTTFLGHTGVMSVAFSPDGTKIVSGSDDNTVRLWDTATGLPIGSPLTGHGGYVRSAAFSPDGKKVVTGSSDGTLILWQIEIGRTIDMVFDIAYQYGSTGLALSPDGSVLVVALEDNTLILLDTTTGQVIGQPLKGHKARIASIAFSSDGKRIVSGSYDQTVRLWDVASGQSINTFNGHTNAVLSVSFSPDGKTVISSSADQALIMWDAASGQEIGKPLTVMGSGSVAFSPDGKTIASPEAGNFYSLILWDVATRQPLWETIRGEAFAIWTIAFSPNGTRLLTGSSGNTLTLWDAATGEAIVNLKGHSEGINSVVFSPDGKRIVSASADQTLIVWDATTGKPIGDPLIGHNESVTGVAFSPDGSRIYSVSEGSTTLLVWVNRSLPELIQWTCDNRYIRPLTADEKIFYGVTADYPCDQ
jgi:WD40 repeat protein/serine/threonine protein kinase